MDDRLNAAICRAREALDALTPAAVAKTIWGSPAGKKRLAKRLAALLPAHETYVEPFAGSAAVLFAKEPSEVEVVNDADPEIAEAFRLIKKLAPADIDRLRGMSWTGDAATFKRLCDASPRGDLEKLHRFLYVTHFSYGKLRGKSFSPSGQGIDAKTVSRIETHAPRLDKVRVYSGDYEKVVRKYDSPDTVFYFDPPYPGYDVAIGESQFDEECFLGVLKSLKGKFLLTYGVRGKLPKLLNEAGFAIKRIRTPRTIRSMRGVGGPTLLTQLLVSNYELVAKGDGDGDEDWALDDWAPEDDDRSHDAVAPLDQDAGAAAADLEDVEKAQPFGTFGGSYHYARRLVPMIPKHTTYVEPFAGAAALLHAKDPSDKEVIADIDSDVVFLHRAIKAMTAERVEQLKRFEWKCTEDSFAKARDMQPTNDLERFYKLVFVRTHARDCRPDGTHPAGNHLGSTTNPEKYLRAAERLKKVSILQQDYRTTVRQHDGPDSFFFLDPPYPGEWYDKDAAIDVGAFAEVLKGIKGRFIAVLNDSPEHAEAFRKVGHIFRLMVREASGTGGAKKASRLFCTNFKVAKAEDIEEVAGEPAPEVDAAPILEETPPPRLDADRDPHDALLAVHAIGRSIHLDLRVREGDELVGWTLAAQRAGGVEAPLETLDAVRSIAEAFSPDGNDLFRSLTEGGIPAIPKKPHDPGWMEERVVPAGQAGAGKSSPGVIVPVERFELSVVRQDEGLIEYRIDGERLRGVLRLARGDSTWVASFVPDKSAFAKTVSLIKGADPEDERYVLGIVLEPEVVDAQGDIYSAEEIRQAAHRFMEEFGGLGLMHRLRVNDQVRVLESYLAPVDFSVGDVLVKKGTWLLALRILSDELWEAVKQGGLRGLSVGGSARRLRETAESRAAA